MSLHAMKMAKEAIEAALKWDADRKFPVPYKVRDPLVLASMKLSSAVSEAEAGEPMFWVRIVDEDGGYQGPIHNSAMDEARKKSGAWSPLFLAPPTHTAAMQAALERAAKVCEDVEPETFWHGGQNYDDARGTARACAAAIRAIKPEDLLEGGK